LNKQKRIAKGRKEGSKNLWEEHPTKWYKIRFFGFDWARCTTQLAKIEDFPDPSGPYVIQ